MRLLKRRAAFNPCTYPPPPQAQLDSERAAQASEAKRHGELVAEVANLRAQLAGEAATREAAQRQLAEARDARDALQVRVMTIKRR